MEQAVRWRVFHQTVQDIKTRNSAAAPDELQALIDDAVQEVRKDKRAKSRVRQSLTRVALDSNILISALLIPVGHPEQVEAVLQFVVQTAEAPASPC